jgi:hypothetical protein
LVHLHPANGTSLRSSSVGTLQGNAVLLSKAVLAGKDTVALRVE